MDTNKVWVAQDYAELSKEDIDSAVPSGMYLKHKTDIVDGAYQKTKARLHAGGHKQWADHYTDITSWMINMSVVFIMLKFMAVFGWLHTVFDIKSAYLHATREHSKRQIMRLTPRLTQQWVKMHPEDVKYVYKDCLYVLLLKALYGLKDSG